MNFLRVVINIIFAFLLACGGIYLLIHQSYFLAGRYHPETGTYFSGVSLYLLAFGLFFFSAFSVAVALAWIKGVVPFPKIDEDKLMPHPTYKGNLLLKFWYLALPAFVCIVSAFALGEKIANPLLQ